MEHFRKTIPTILLVVLCIVAFLSFLRIGDLEDQMQHLNNRLNNMDDRLNNMDDSLRNDMSNLVGNVENMLEQEASILADYQYEVGELNPDTLTIPVTVTITPKYQQGNTAVALQTEAGMVLLSRSGVIYTALLDMAINEELVRPLAVITVDGQQSVQALEWYITPLEYAKLYVSTSIGYIESAPCYRLTGPVDVYIEGNNVDTVEKVELVAELDGVEQRREEMELAAKGTGTPYATFMPDDYEWDIEEGSQLMIYADVYSGELIWRFAVDGAAHKNGRTNRLDLLGWLEPIELRTMDGAVISFDWNTEYGY